MQVRSTGRTERPLNNGKHWPRAESQKQSPSHSIPFLPSSPGCQFCDAELMLWHAKHVTLPVQSKGRNACLRILKFAMQFWESMPEAMSEMPLSCDKQAMFHTMLGAGQVQHTQCCQIQGSASAAVSQARMLAASSRVLQAGTPSN